MTIAQLIPGLQTAFPKNEIVDIKKNDENSFSILFKGTAFYRTVTLLDNDAVFVVIYKEVPIGVFKINGEKIA